MRSRFIRFVAAPVAGVALLTAAAAGAHHSTAMFYWGKEVKIANATVERWDWTNPHTFLYVTVPTPAGPEHWAFEGMSPNHLGRTGWTKRSLAAGDKISLVYYPLKDGRKGGFDTQVVLPNGQTLHQLSSPTDNPAKEP
ncbi:MAG: DUF6152 family protein [Janthinobacterium lividum]